MLFTFHYENIRLVAALLDIPSFRRENLKLRNYIKTNRVLRLFLLEFLAEYKSKVGTTRTECTFACFSLFNCYFSMDLVNRLPFCICEEGENIMG